MFKKISLNLKLFLGAFFLSLPFWWSVNIFQKNLEDFFFKFETVDGPQIFAAQIVIPQKISSEAPLRNWIIDNLKIDAKSAISVFVDSQGKEKIIFEKSVDEKLPIASLTKLMTADIVWEKYDLSQSIQISAEAVKAVKEEGASGNFKTGENLKVENLIHSLLIESSNDAAEALTEVIGREAFVSLMNLQATSTIGMRNTSFVNPTGLDPDEPNGPINYSTARDLAKLTSYLYQKYPQILQISALPEYDLYTSEGIFHHKAINTDGLLGKVPGILGSKTGLTPAAGGCLVLVQKSPNNKGVIINVILGSADRFGEMKKLIDWVGQAYQW